MAAPGCGTLAEGWFNMHSVQEAPAAFGWRAPLIGGMLFWVCAIWPSVAGADGVEFALFLFRNSFTYDACGESRVGNDLRAALSEMTEICPLTRESKEIYRQYAEEIFKEENPRALYFFKHKSKTSEFYGILTAPCRDFVESSRMKTIKRRMYRYDRGEISAEAALFGRQSKKLFIQHCRMIGDLKK